MRAPRLGLLLCALVLAAAGSLGIGYAEPGKPPAHRLRVHIDPGAHRLRAVDRLRWRGGGPLAFSLHPDLRVRKVTVDGSPYDGHRSRDQPTHWRGDRALGGGSHTAVIRYAGTLKGSASRNRNAVPPALGPRISPQGIYLDGGPWYPENGSLRNGYRVTATTPRGIRVVVPGRREGGKASGDSRTVRFRMDHPAQSIVLLGGPYRVRREGGPGNVEVATYLHPGLGKLAGPY
ncbi:MAG TPA: hypothetical protein VKA48_05625, partial [Gammaproteobacteria bacterium]|nr:hypothetical protein [Gammaproteobacteria bacterium]